MSPGAIATNNSPSADQLHRISRVAKISASMIALALHDLDGPVEHRENASDWIFSQEGGNFSLSGCGSLAACSEALANLNAYLNHYGLDATPIGPASTSDHHRGIGVEASTPLEAVDASIWHSAIQHWASDSVSTTTRRAIADQLVDIVDHQVQACYSHLREHTQEIEGLSGHKGSTYGNSERERNNEDVLILDDSHYLQGPS